MTSKKTLFKNISLFLCLIPMLVLSLFCLVPRDSKLSVFAADTIETSYSFTGSNIYTSFTNDYSSHVVKYGLFSFDFGVNNNGKLFANIKGSYYDNNTILTAETGVKTFSSIIPPTFIVQFGGNGGNVQPSVQKSSTLPSANLVKVRFYSETTTSKIGTTTIYYYYNCVAYYDDLDNYVAFRIPCTFDDSSYDLTDFMFDDRTYYLSNAFGSVDGYDAGYDAGYSDGYSVGNSDGNSTGYDDGYQAGEIVGYDRGYSDGINDSNQYTFNNLIGAVIDAPVSAFTSLLNFELLGINILGLITGLLSVAVIVLIVKLCLGGK